LESVAGFEAGNDDHLVTGSIYGTPYTGRFGDECERSSVTEVEDIVVEELGRK
jgi:hypothetical protein